MTGKAPVCSGKPESDAAETAVWKEWSAKVRLQHKLVERWQADDRAKAKAEKKVKDGEAAKDVVG